MKNKIFESYWMMRIQYRKLQKLETRSESNKNNGKINKLRTRRINIKWIFRAGVAKLYIEKRCIIFRTLTKTGWLARLLSCYLIYLWLLGLYSAVFLLSHSSFDYLQLYNFYGFVSLHVLCNISCYYLLSLLSIPFFLSVFLLCFFY